MGAITLGQAIVAAGDPDVDASVEPLVVVPMQPLFVPLEPAFAVYWAADVVTGRARVGGVELKAVGAGDVQMASSAARLCRPSGGGERRTFRELPRTVATTGPRASR